VDLLPGTRFGAYEILSLLGRGGMGEVHRARDTKLRREVAIKVLPVWLATDPDRLQRFEREAQMLASLNHTHIAAIYGVEEVGSTVGLILELVEMYAAVPSTSPSRVRTAVARDRRCAARNRRGTGG
jgi:eukaryotic-like serine/threonine-protein kinase